MRALHRWALRHRAVAGCRPRDEGGKEGKDVEVPDGGEEGGRGGQKGEEGDVHEDGPGGAGGRGYGGAPVHLARLLEGELDAVSSGRLQGPHCVVIELVVL